jgi:hypothetical protein
MAPIAADARCARKARTKVWRLSALRPPRCRLKRGEGTKRASPGRANRVAAMRKRARSAEQTTLHAQRQEQPRSNP